MNCTVDTDPSIDTDMSVEKLCENLEAYYGQANVYKAVIFTADDTETIALFKLLTDAHHSVCQVLESDIHDDRNVFMNCIREFAEINHRVMIISAQALHHIKSELEVHVLPEQNLVAFGNVHDEGISLIRSWIVDANNRGFVTMPDCAVLELAHM